MALVKVALFALLASDAALGARRLRGNQDQRDQRSLTNTFPFNQKAGAEEHHEHHEHHEGHHEASELASRDQRQGADVDVSFPAVAAAGPGSDGKKCSKWPKEVCSVSKKPVKKYTPITGCTKEPRELCAPAGCGFKEGAEECFDKVQTVVQDAPKEQCSLEPQRTCKHVTKLVPKLEPTEECVDVPKEVCTRSRTNPRKVKKPVVKKWCYVPTEESGLA